MDVSEPEPPGGEQGGAAAHRTAEKIESDLMAVKRGARTLEVAHTQDREYYERFRRILGISVVALTAANGTAVVTALATSTGTWAKVLVGVLSVASAIVAALNEKGPYKDQVELHAVAASGFSKVARKAIVLDRSWTIGHIDADKAEQELTALEESYDDLKSAAPDLRDYQRAYEWVDRQEREHGRQP